ncbi:MAG: DNA translocase FtsK, partial [Clostridia bacterium]|nr:DNA translocase FtsK [Clostridia bacterium]
MAKKRKKGKKKSNNMQNITVVGTIILSVLLVVLVFTESGYVGSGLSKFLGGMMGWLKYIFPLGTLLVGINMACKENKYISTKLFQYSILLFFVSVVASIFEVLNGRIDVNKEMSEIMKIAYNNGAMNSMGGGAIGTLAAVPLVKMLGKVGSVILSIGIAVILFAVTFGIDISNIINNWIEGLIERKQEQIENRKLRREQYEKEEYEEYERVPVENIKKNKKQKRGVISSDLDIIDDDQIQINLNGRAIAEEHTNGIKYQHDKDDIVPLGLEKENKKSGIKKEIQAVQPDYIENNLFKQEEEIKEDKTKQVLQLEHALVVEDENYEYPPLEILSMGEKKTLKGGARALADIATKLQKTLYSFGVSAKVENVSVGPAITRYELKPAEGVRVNKIANLADDIALNLAAETIRIEAPIPGKQAVGIEVPNSEKEVVHLREVLESDEFQGNKSKLSVALGKDVGGKAVVA